MKFYLSTMALAVLVLLSGCAEERIPADQADAWEESDKSTQSASTPTPQPGESAPQAGQTVSQAGASADVVAVVNGNQFQIGGEAISSEEGTLARGHYFEATAPVELKSAATTVETEIEGQNANGAVPVVGLFVETEDGKRILAVDNRPIDGKQVLVDKAEIPAGNYRVRMTYFKDTVGKVRPRITLRSITFKK